MRQIETQARPLLLTSEQVYVDTLDLLKEKMTFSEHCDKKLGLNYSGDLAQYNQLLNRVGGFLQRMNDGLRQNPNDRSLLVHIGSALVVLSYWGEERVGLEGFNQLRKHYMWPDGDSIQSVIKAKTGEKAFALAIALSQKHENIAFAKLPLKLSSMEERIKHETVAASVNLARRIEVEKAVFDLAEGRDKKRDLLQLETFKTQTEEAARRIEEELSSQKDQEAGRKRIKRTIWNQLLLEDRAIVSKGTKGQTELQKGVWIPGQFITLDRRMKELRKTLVTTERDIDAHDVSKGHFDSLAAGGKLHEIYATAIDFLRSREDGNWIDSLSSTDIGELTVLGNRKDVKKLSSAICEVLSDDDFRIRLLTEMEWIDTDLVYMLERIEAFECIVNIVQAADKIEVSDEEIRLAARARLLNDFTEKGISAEFLLGVAKDGLGEGFLSEIYATYADFHEALMEIEDQHGRKTSEVSNQGVDTRKLRRLILILGLSAVTLLIINNLLLQKASETPSVTPTPTSYSSGIEVREGTPIPVYVPSETATAAVIAGNGLLTDTVSPITEGITGSIPITSTEGETETQVVNPTITPVAVTGSNPVTPTKVETEIPILNPTGTPEGGLVGPEGTPVISEVSDGQEQGEIGLSPEEWLRRFLEQFGRDLKGVFENPIVQRLLFAWVTARLRKGVKKMYAGQLLNVADQIFSQRTADDSKRDQFLALYSWLMEYKGGNNMGRDVWNLFILPVLHPYYWFTMMTEIFSAERIYQVSQRYETAQQGIASLWQKTGRDPVNFIAQLSGVDVKKVRSTFELQNMQIQMPAVVQETERVINSLQIDESIKRSLRDSIHQGPFLFGGGPQQFIRGSVVTGRDFLELIKRWIAYEVGKIRPELSTWEKQWEYAENVVSQIQGLGVIAQMYDRARGVDIWERLGMTLLRPGTVVYEWSENTRRKRWELKSQRRSVIYERVRNDLR